jgi:hypothetical protein
MIKRLALFSALLVASAISAQTASANQTNAPDALLVTAVCSSQAYQLAVNGNGTFTPGHVVGSSQEFVPTAFELTFTATDPSGSRSTRIQRPFSPWPSAPRSSAPSPWSCAAWPSCSRSTSSIARST